MVEVAASCSPLLNLPCKNGFGQRLLGVEFSEDIDNMNAINSFDGEYVDADRDLV